MSYLEGRNETRLHLGRNAQWLLVGGIVIVYLQPFLGKRKRMFQSFWLFLLLWTYLNCFQSMHLAYTNSEEWKRNTRDLQAVLKAWQTLRFEFLPKRNRNQPIEPMTRKMECHHMSPCSLVFLFFPKSAWKSAWAAAQCFSFAFARALVL